MMTGATTGGNKNQGQVIGMTIGKASLGKAIGTNMTTGPATLIVGMTNGEATNTKNADLDQEAVGKMHQQSRMMQKRKRLKKPKKKPSGQKMRQSQRRRPKHKSRRRRNYWRNQTWHQISITQSKIGARLGISTS